jgi:hypothetical protein
MSKLTVGDVKMATVTTPTAVQVPNPTMVVVKTPEGSWSATLTGYVTPRDIAMGQRALLLAFRKRVFQMRLDEVTAQAAQEKANA